MSEDHWTYRACAALRGLQERDGGWAYRAGSAPSAEPTALAVLALIASSHDAIDDAEHRRLTRAGEWLARTQRADGSVGLAGTGASAAWMTPYAVLVWHALDSHPAPRRRAANWLLSLKGRTLDPREDPLRIAGHDT